MPYVNQKFFCWSLICVIVATVSAGTIVAQSPAKKITFDDHVKPLLNRRCSSCHNSNRREGDLDVTNYINLMQGGGSGTVLESEDVAGSYLHSLVTHEDSPEMPPNGNKIPANEIKLIADWIAGGLLENVNSKAAKARPKVNMTLTAAPTARPKTIPVPMRLPLQPVITPKVGSVATIANSPWAPILAISTPKQILLYRTDRLELSGVLPNPAESARSLNFSRNGQWLIAGGGRDGESGTSLLYDVRTGELAAKLGENRDAVLAADLTPNQATIAAGGPSKLVTLISVADESKKELKRHTGWVTALQFSPNGKFLATADRNGGLLIWEADSGAFIQKLDGHPKMITKLAWRSDSQFFVTAGEDGSLKIWNPELPKAVKSWGAHGGGCLAVGYRRDGTIFSAGRDRLVKLWNSDGKAIRTFKGLGDIAVAVAVCDETNRIFAADWSGKLLAWNVDSDKPVKTLAANPPSVEQRLNSAGQALKKAKSQQAVHVQPVKRISARLADLGKKLEINTNASKKLNQQLAKQNELVGTLGLQSRRATSATWERIDGIKKDRRQSAQLDLALKAAKEALAALPDDEVLQNSTLHLEKRIAKVQSRITSMPDELQFWRDEQERLSGLLENANQQFKGLLARQLPLQKQRKNLSGQIAALQAKLKKEQVTEMAINRDVGRLQQIVSRWNNEIEFIKALDHLKDQKLASQKKLAEKSAAIDRAKSELRKATDGVKRAKQAAAQGEAEVKAIEQKIQQLRKIDDPVTSPSPVTTKSGV
jgi:WD40 repeat protein